MKKGEISESVAKRRDRVFDLVLIDGHDRPEQIAELMMAERTLVSKSIESAIRLVQSDMALIRDVTEHRRYVMRRLYAMRGFRRIAEDDSQILLDVVTPKGDTVTVAKPRWPATVRVNALHHFSGEAEAIARCQFVDVTGKKKARGADVSGGVKKNAVPIDLSELPEDERAAISEAMTKLPGGEDDPSRLN